MGARHFRTTIPVYKKLKLQKCSRIWKSKNTYMEYQNVGARVGGGFENTAELRLTKYSEAISGPDGEAWKKEIQNEHERMVKKVFEAIPRSKMP